MPAKEIKELREKGKLAEAYAMAKAELDLQPDNIWCMRNISWVYYDYLNQNAGNLQSFLKVISQLMTLQLPTEEVMFYDNICIPISKAVRLLNDENPYQIQKLHALFDAIKNIPFNKDGKWYSVMFGAFQKHMKYSSRHIEFVDWWGFENFKTDDYISQAGKDGKPIMSLVEQTYIAYAKQLLPKKNENGVFVFNKEKAVEFIPKLIQIENSQPDYQFPSYYIAKLLMAAGDEEYLFDYLLPFVKKKRNNFWVWELLADAFKEDSEKVLACYCKALLCKSPEEMLVGLRQKMARLLISQNYFTEAKTEINLLVEAKNKKGSRVPNEVIIWQTLPWFNDARTQKSNISFYHKFAYQAESILYSDIPEELIFVDFVNKDKKIVNFFNAKEDTGFFKYERFLKNVNVGDVLKVRVQNGSRESIYQLYTCIIYEDALFKSNFIKEIEGKVKIKPGKSFGFLEDVFIHPSIVSKHKLEDGQHFQSKAIKSYNREKKQWGWKIIN
jgi:hypothetical protein